MNASLSQQRLKDLLRYSPTTGLWKAIAPRARNGRTIYGWHRGTPCERGRHPQLQIMVDGKRYLASRLAVLWMTGSWPIGKVRHLDGDRSNNRWSNLRDLGSGEGGTAAPKIGRAKLPSTDGISTTPGHSG